MSSRRFAFRFSLFFLALFFGTGVQLPFLPLWLASKGLSAADIAFILAMQIAVRVLSAPAGAFVADRMGNRRFLIQAGAAASFVFYVMMCFAEGFWPIFITFLLAGSCFSMIVPLAEGFAVEGAQLYGLDFGRLRLWGTVSFMGGNLVAGSLLEVIAVSHVIVMIAVAQFTLAAVAQFLPADPVKRSAAGAPALRFRDVGRLLGTRPFLFFLLAVSFGQASHALYYGFGSLHWKSLGYSEGVIGVLWLTGGIAEVLVFALSGKAAARAGPFIVIITGIAGGALRWLVTASDPPLLLLFAVQTFHAFSFTFTHLGTMHYIQRHVPGSLRNTAQGLYAAFSSGLAMSLVTMASGPLYSALGGLAYLAMAGVSLAGLGFALALRRISPTEPLRAET